MDAMPGNTRESTKIMLVDKTIVCPIIQKVLFKNQNDQNWPHKFVCIENLLSVMLLVLAFFSQKSFFFLLLGHQCIPKKAHLIY